MLKSFFINSINDAAMNQGYHAGLFHSTTYNNLLGILETGKLCSRDYLDNNDIPFEDRYKTNEISKRCSEKVGNKIAKKYARFYLKKNAPAFYEMKEDECILEFLPEAILPRKNVKFIYGNINNGGSEIFLKDTENIRINAFNIVQCSNIEKEFNVDFDLIYDNKDIYYYDFLGKRYAKDELKSEVHILDYVDIKYLNKIYFKNYTMYNKFVTDYPEYKYIAVSDKILKSLNEDEDIEFF